MSIKYLYLRTQRAALFAAAVPVLLVVRGIGLGTQAIYELADKLDKKADALTQRVFQALKRKGQDLYVQANSQLIDFDLSEPELRGAAAAEVQALREKLLEEVEAKALAYDALLNEQLDKQRLALESRVLRYTKVI